MQTGAPPKLLKACDAAAYLAVSVATLRSWRLTRRRGSTTGPVFIRFGRAIRYRVADLDAWVEQHRCRRAAHGDFGRDTGVNASQVIADP